MSSLDFRLRDLLRRLPGDARVHVLLQYRKNLRELIRLGFSVSSVAGDIAAGSVEIQFLDDLGRHPDVILIGGSRLLKDEEAISLSAINLSSPVSGVRTIPTLGRGSIIGVVDSGFDLTHPCFRRANGKTRILAAWDQSNIHNVAGRAPRGFDYGIELDSAAINRYLEDGKPLIVRNQERAGGHGTYVAGIAGGNVIGDEIFEGVAPEAELILVTYRNNNDVPIGGSAFVVDAINYIRRLASERELPVVINLSQGDSLGAHDGTSLLERAIDNVISEGRVLVVNSAGNERSEYANHHARGQVMPGGKVIIPFLLAIDDTHPVDGDTIDLWYRRGDRFVVSLRTPDGWESERIEPDTSALITFPSGNRAQIYSETNYPTNGDNRIGVFLEKGEGWQGGIWELVLRGDSVRLGDFDAWADRSNGTTAIDFQSYQSFASIVTLPGNARRVITVGGFVFRPEDKAKDVPGSLARGSSLGPTRDGRVKPDLTAPSTGIMAPSMLLDSSQPAFGWMSGTSMAAPHVSGVIALLWSLWPRLKAEHIRRALCSTAQVDKFTSVAPNTGWGMGKIDAEAAYKALSELIKKGGSIMENKIAFEFEMKPQENSGGQPAEMRVRIEVTDGETMVISGSSGGDSYQGMLVFRKVSEPSAVESAGLPEHTLMTGGDLGGDECYINGKWYNPCPVGGVPPPQ